MWWSESDVRCICKVCDSYLGSRKKYLETEFFCSDCKWYYTFWPDGKVTPKSEHEKASTCDCGSCHRSTD